MMKLHHFMVDFEDGNGAVRFANESPILDFAAAKSTAEETSREHGSAYVVAFAEDGNGKFRSIGHMPFHWGVADLDGVEGVEAAFA